MTLYSGRACLQPVDFPTKEPHDMIYAILALAKDTHMKTSAKPITSRSRANSCNAVTPVAQSSEVILEETTAARSNIRTRETCLSSTDQEASLKKRQGDPLEDGEKRFCSTSAHQHDPQRRKEGAQGPNTMARSASVTRVSLGKFSITLNRLLIQKTCVFSMLSMSSCSSISASNSYDSLCPNRKVLTSFAVHGHQNRFRDKAKRRSIEMMFYLDGYPL